MGAEVPTSVEAPEVAVEASAPAAAAEATTSLPEGGTGTPPAPGVEVEAEASEVEAPPEFDWGVWDGEPESLPEAAREWAQPFRDHYSGELSAHLAEVEELKGIYDQLLAETGDPRVAGLEAKIQELEQAQAGVAAEWEEKHRTQASEFQAYRAQVEAAIDQEADEYSKHFQAENSDLFEDEALAQTFTGLLEEGWELETGAKAARLAPRALQAARQAKADGVPDTYALQLAGRVKSPAAPRVGAKLISGAVAPTRGREQALIPERGAKGSFKDTRLQVARRALKGA